MMIVLGAVSCFLGAKFFPYVLATATSGIVFTFVTLMSSLMGIFYVFSEDEDDRSVPDYLVASLGFAISLGAAALAGWLIYKLRRLGASILGACLGFLGGTLLYNVIFGMWLDSVIALAVIAFGLAIFGGWFIWKFDKDVLVYLTSLLGGYLLVRGVSLFIGDFPNEITTFQEIISGQFKLETTYYAYIGAIFITCLSGIIVQHKLGFASHKSDDSYRRLN